MSEAESSRPASAVSNSPVASPGATGGLPASAGSPQPSDSPIGNSAGVAYLSACPECGCRDLFIRKDFPQKLGLAIVAGAALAFLILAAWPRTFYLGVLILMAATLLDAVLYFVVRKITVCYRCRAEFRNVPVNPEHHGYELAVGEKYRER